MKLMNLNLRASHLHGYLGQLGLIESHKVFQELRKQFHVISLSDKLLNEIPGEGESKSTTLQ